MKRLADLQDYLEEEDQTTRKTIRKFKKELELYERSFNLCSETIDYLCSRTKRKLMDSSAKEVILVILPRIIQSLQSIRVLILKGYYYDALILDRSYFEAVGLCAYLSLNEEEAENWLEGKELGVSSIKLLDYIPKLLEKSDSEVNLKPVYGQLCDYVHTNAEAVVSLVSDWHSKKLGKISLRFTPTFNESKVPQIASRTTLLCIVLREIFKNELAKERKSRIAEFLKQFRKERKLR
jgi:hypothetical protein